MNGPGNSQTSEDKARVAVSECAKKELQKSMQPCFFPFIRLLAKTWAEPAGPEQAQQISELKAVIHGFGNAAESMPKLRDLLNSLRVTSVGKLLQAAGPHMLPGTSEAVDVHVLLSSAACFETVGEVLKLAQFLEAENLSYDSAEAQQFQEALQPTRAKVIAVRELLLSGGADDQHPVITLLDHCLLMLASAMGEIYRHSTWVDDGEAALQMRFVLQFWQTLAIYNRTNLLENDNALALSFP